MQVNKNVLLEQEKRLKQELSMDIPQHRRTEVEALLCMIDAQLKNWGKQ